MYLFTYTVHVPLSSCFHDLHALLWSNSGNSSVEIIPPEQRHLEHHFRRVFLVWDVEGEWDVLLGVKIITPSILVTVKEDLQQKTNT